MALLKLDRLGARERWGLGVALVVLLVLLVDQLVISMVADRIQSVRAQAVTESKALYLNRQVLQTEGPITAQYEAIKQLLAGELSDAEAIEAMRGAIGDLADASGVSTPGSMKPRAPSGASEGYREYVIDIPKFQSSMESLLTFLHGVWVAPGMMRVKKLSITPSAEEGMIEGSLMISKLLIGDGAERDEIGDR